VIRLRELATVTLLSCVLAQPSPGAERTLRRDEVPAAVLSAFSKAWPAATVVAFAEETKDGKTYFEIESRDGKVARDVLLAPDGSIVEVEEVVPVATLPAAVVEAVHALGPHVVIQKAERVTRGKVVTYSLQLKGAKVREVAFDPAGAPAGL
jgi:hypothetical protein